LRAVARAVGAAREPFHLAVTATASGLDVAISGSGPLSKGVRQMLTDLSISHAIARIAVDGEIVVEPRKPVVEVGGVAVSPPPGGFLQAVAAAEEAMAALVLGHLGKAKRVVDLFSG